MSLSTHPFKELQDKKDGKLILEFEGNDNLSLERLYSIPFMQVVDKLHKEFSSRYNLEAKVIGRLD